MKFYNTISRVQIRAKCFLAKRRLRYAIMNKQWDKIEQNITKKKNLNDDEHK